MKISGGAAASAESVGGNSNMARSPIAIVWTGTTTRVSGPRMPVGHGNPLESNAREAA